MVNKYHLHISDSLVLYYYIVGNNYEITLLNFSRALLIPRPEIMYFCRIILKFHSLFCMPSNSSPMCTRHVSIHFSIILCKITVKLKNYNKLNEIKKTISELVVVKWD
ncbi:hypothetical protein QTP88_010788 [Uroleucon formosanum]